MDTRTHSPAALEGPAFHCLNRIAPACYRVVARHRDRSQSLVTLAENLRQAANFAKTFCDAMEGGSRDGIVFVRVEEWIGTLVEGRWRLVNPHHGGFVWASSRDANTRDARSRGGDRNSALPQSGEKVQCILIPEKTRRGGWRAKLLRRGTVGPITNTADMPNSAQPGQMVTLRVGAISHDGKRIQFYWNHADSSDHQ